MIRVFTSILLLTILAVAAVHSSALERTSPEGGESSDNSAADALKISDSVESKLEESVLSDEVGAEVREGADIEDTGLVREKRRGHFHGGHHGYHGGHRGYGGWGRGGYGYGGWGRGGYGYGGRIGLGYGYGGYYAGSPLGNTYCVLYPQYCYGYY